MNVFDELRELERRGERFNTDRARPAGVREEQGRRTQGVVRLTRRSISARLKLLAPGGFLVTCSCSYNVSEGDFADVIASAAGRRAAQTSRSVEKRMQARDHPVLMTGAGNLLSEVFHSAEASLTVTTLPGRVT
jgi:23S rRNA (cytosine1962-C5)-methyltransferase